MEDIISRRINHNKTRDSDGDPTIKRTPQTLIYKLAQAISFEFRVIIQKAAVTQEEGENVVVAALQRIKNDKVFGSKDLTDEKAFAIATHYEVLRKSADDMLYIDHDIVADYLAAPILAQNWQDLGTQFNAIIGQDVWIFAAKHIAENQTNQFLKHVSIQNILLASRCAVAIGENSYPIVEAQLFKNSASDSYLTATTALTGMAVLKS
ncbi:MAG: hypothetical protein ACI9FJ_002075 [Alteromonadaceae bacterium]